jgi:hypothetical protein
MSNLNRPDVAGSGPAGPPEKFEGLLARHRSTILWVLVVMAGLLLAWFVTYTFARGPDVSRSVVRYEVVDPSHLRVFVRLTNSGTAEGLDSCLVEASIPGVDALGGFEEVIGEGQSKVVPVEFAVPDAAEQVDAVHVGRCTTA